MRCLVDGRFMRRLTPTGNWWMCSRGCPELRCSKPEVEFGWQLLEFGWQLLAGRKVIQS